ncbi:MAG: asparagine synthase (glutamine-hydrolyzing) [Verrucomicrobia bacterium]|nr:asparagine synthase (glutamine-hydrolyzing) [Verrucomicrobiota bacterium]
MCGICGFNWRDETLVRRMADEIAHRGPDQHGAYVNDHVSLGHRRLSIIDLSDHGRQPMSNEDGSVWLAFNGEIYNFQELRQELIQKGHTFASHTDSEVIIHAYEEYGVGALDRLRGMFAIAIWDSRDQSLFLARDRIGIKPLYYYHHDLRFIFASEIKAILTDKSVPRELNPQALYDYIGFEFVPAPETFFRGIRKLPAGHYLRLTRDGRLEEKAYWDLSLRPHDPMPTFEEAVERERELLDEAVKSHLISDVPLGVFLSGGLDSSALVAMMRRHISGPLRTFTIGYEDKSFSELDFARQVADVFETEHHVLMLDNVNADNTEKALWHLDEPMTDLSAVPLMLLCAKAKEHITVCLSGEGGDESFAGYDRFKASRLNQTIAWLPSPIRRHVIGKLVGLLPDQPQKKGAINMLKRFMEGANLPPEAMHLRWQYFTNAQQDKRLFRDSFADSVSFDAFRAIRAHTARSDATDRVNREIYLDMRFMMTDSVLMKVDKMSMASALEVRVPLLDHVLVEYIASLPGDWKLKGLTTKHVLRAGLKGLLPDNIVNRGKQGYSLPVKQLLRDQLKDYMITLLNDSPLIRETMNTDFVNQLIREHLAQSHNHNHVLWALMNAAIWHNRFLPT